VAAALLGCVAATSFADPLRHAYDPQEVRSRQPMTAARIAPCPPLVDPPRELRHESKFRAGDGTASVVDPERQAAEEAAVRPVRTYNRLVSDVATHSLRDPRAARLHGACVLKHLDHWAQGRAFLGGSNSTQGDFEMKWTSITASLAYLDVVEFADAESARRIETWLNQIGHDVRRYYSIPVPSAMFSSRNNNHAYWAALSTVAIGVATSDRKLFDWGMRRFGQALDDIDSRGLLPQELRRASLALSYHQFALEPLLLLRLFAEANGISTNETRDQALRRLAARVAEGLIHPQTFEEFSGQPQGGALPAPPFRWAWAELALAIWPDRELEARINARRPYGHVWLGGELTVRYRRAR
jgi:poly(beta-D-mannuronate) lyase